MVNVLDYIMPHYNYWAAILLLAAGLYTILSRGNLIKKLVGMNLFQVSMFMLYISMGKVTGGTAPILTGKPEIFSNPLPHVLILTAIVVGVATTAIGLALAVRIKYAYGTIEEDEILAMDRAQEQQEMRAQ